MDIVFVGERYSTQLRRLMKSAPYAEQLLIGLVIWWNFVHYIFFEPSRNECGEIDECIGCNIEDCYDIHGDGTNKKCKWKNLIDKEAEEMKDDN